MNNRIKTTVLFSFIFGVVTLFHTTEVNALFDNIFTDAEAARKLNNGEKLGFFERWQGARYNAAQEKKLAEKINKRTTRLAKIKASATKERDLAVAGATADKERIYANLKASAQQIRKTLNFFETSSVAKPAILTKDEMEQIKENILALVTDFEKEIKTQEETITAIIATKKAKEITTIPEGGTGFLSDDEDEEDDNRLNNKAKRAKGKYGV